MQISLLVVNAHKSFLLWDRPLAISVTGDSKTMTLNRLVSSMHRGAPNLLPLDVNMTFYCTVKIIVLSVQVHNSFVFDMSANAIAGGSYHFL